MKKRQTTVNFRYPVFAGLPSLHYGGLTAFVHLLRSGNPAPPHSTCPTPSPFRCSDYMTTPTIYCYIFRPPGKWFWTILHATSSLPARWTPLVERKPYSKESGINISLPVVQLESDADINRNVEVDAHTVLGPELCNDWNFSVDHTPASLFLYRALGPSENGGRSFLSFGLHA